MQLRLLLEEGVVAQLALEFEGGASLRWGPSLRKSLVPGVFEGAQCN